MLATLILGAVFRYGFPSTPLGYSVSLNFDGYLPVLGGIEQKVKVEMNLLVSVKAGEIENLAATTSLTAFKLAMMDLESGKFEPMPFTLESVKPFFPDNVTTVSPRGKILGTTAPASNLPIRLPGLNTQHIPDATYLLLEFPEGSIELEKPWSYTRKFGEEELFFEGIFKKMVDKCPVFLLKVKQEYKTFEDENRNPVTDPKDAELTVTTKVSAEGTVVMTDNPGILKEGTVTAMAVSTVVNSKGEVQPERRLKTTFEIKLNRKKE